MINLEELKVRDLLTPAEAAWLLHMSESTLYKLILEIDPATKKPALYSVKIGARRYIPRRAIDRSLEGL